MATARDWRFVRTPFWIFSHLFVASIVGSFLWAFLWQLDRHDDKQAENAVIESRALVEGVSVAEALQRPVDQLDFVAISDSGRFIEPEVVRVANRTQRSIAGDWLVGLYETDDGALILVNRGFIPREDAADPAIDGPITGWLRESREQEGIAVADTGEGERIPRLNVEAIQDRLGVEVAPLWLQLESPTGAVFPEPVPLPSLGSGPHLSYAGQWLIFAVLGIVVYALLLRKNALVKPGGD